MREYTGGQGGEEEEKKKEDEVSYVYLCEARPGRDGESEGKV